MKEVNNEEYHPTSNVINFSERCSETYIVSPNTKHGLPTLTEEPNLYQAPSFDFFDFSEIVGTEGWSQCLVTNSA